ncbi:MAG: 16S rRNA (uracil(1498)-N(3))-methyltransferase [Bacilli bacterium]|nr:16S rRNA (uracil(1498)-N(3))-methyltransferase [Bacilli bacterium]
MQRYFSNSKENDKLFLINDDIYHITRVMRMKDNDKIEVIYDNDLYICNVILNELPWVDIVSKEEGKIEDKEIILAIPLLKEQKMDLVLQKATELGVTKIIPVTMERSIVKLADSKEVKKIDRWSKICKEASEQSKRNSIPVISNIMTLKELVKEEGIKIVCSTIEKENNLKKFLTEHKNYDKIIIVVGPEGGISSKEEEYLVSEGFTRVSLGKRIMRVETVPIFILSALNYEFME